MLDVGRGTTPVPWSRNSSHPVAPYGVQMAIEHIRGVPPVVNAPEAVDLLTDAAISVGVGPVPAGQSMGGEDFAWYLTKVPGAMARLGTYACRVVRPSTCTKGDLVVDEASVTHGARVLTAAVLSRRLPGRRRGRQSGNERSSRCSARTV